MTQQKETKTICYCVTIFDYMFLAVTEKMMFYTIAEAEQCFKELKFKNLSVRLSALEVTSTTTVSEKILSM